jgi:hypothetical protein
MKHLLIGILISILLLGCNPDKNKRADPLALKFSTTDDARLFFKNLRQQAYDLQEMSAAKLLVYRLRDRRQDATDPLLLPAIVLNWRYDEAYLLLEPNEHVNQDEPVQIQWYDSLAQKGGIYHYDYGNKEEQLKFAGQLYGSILDSHQLYYLTADSLSLPFFSQKKDREVFRITLLDYYRLTRNIK